MPTGRRLGGDNAFLQRRGSGKKHTMNLNEVANLGVAADQNIMCLAIVRGITGVSFLGERGDVAGTIRQLLCAASRTPRAHSNNGTGCFG